jgi:hypothetical protein
VDQDPDQTQTSHNQNLKSRAVPTFHMLYISSRTSMKGLKVHKHEIFFDRYLQIPNPIQGQAQGRGVSTGEGRTPRGVLRKNASLSPLLLLPSVPATCPVCPSATCEQHLKPRHDCPLSPAVLGDILSADPKVKVYMDPSPSLCFCPSGASRLMKN